jgi:hypothetical protein
VMKRWTEECGRLERRNKWGRGEGYRLPSEKRKLESVQTQSGTHGELSDRDSENTNGSYEGLACSIWTQVRNKEEQHEGEESDEHRKFKTKTWNRRSWHESMSEGRTAW